MRPASSIDAVTISASSLAAALQGRSAASPAGRARASARQRSKVPTPIPTRCATASSEPLSGGNSCATTRSLNRFPYLATSVALCRRKEGFYPGATKLTEGEGRGAPAAAHMIAGWAIVEYSPNQKLAHRIEE